MGKKYKRELLLHINKYQKKIIFPVLCTCFITIILLFLCLDYYVSSRTYKSLHYYSFDIESLQVVIPIVLVSTIGVLSFIIFWIFHFTNKILGPFPRVTKELEEIVAGKRKGPIIARKGDEMFKELLKHINALIQKRG